MLWQYQMTTVDFNGKVARNRDKSEDLPCDIVFKLSWNEAWKLNDLPAAAA